MSSIAYILRKGEKSYVPVVKLGFKTKQKKRHEKASSPYNQLHSLSWLCFLLLAGSHKINHF